MNDFLTIAKWALAAYAFFYMMLFGLVLSFIGFIAYAILKGR